MNQKAKKEEIVQNVCCTLWPGVVEAYLQQEYHVLNKNWINDTIILYECRFPEKIIKYIRTKDNSVKIIYWLWNTIGKSGCNTKD